MNTIDVIHYSKFIHYTFNKDTKEQNYVLIFARQLYSCRVFFL